MKRILISLLLTGGAALAQDARWVFISETDDTNFYLRAEPSSEAVPGDHKFWWKAVPKKGALPIYAENPKAGKFTEYVQYTRLHCQSKQMAMISGVYYERQRNILSTPGNEYALAPIVPDSIGESFYRAYCVR